MICNTKSNVFHFQHKITNIDFNSKSLICRPFIQINKNLKIDIHFVIIYSFSVEMTFPHITGCLSITVQMLLWFKDNVNQKPVHWDYCLREVQNDIPSTSGQTYVKLALHLKRKDRYSETQSPEICWLKIKLIINCVYF